LCAGEEEEEERKKMRFINDKILKVRKSHVFYL